MSDLERCARCDEFKTVWMIEGFTGSPINGAPLARYVCEQCLDDLGIEKPNSEGGDK